MVRREILRRLFDLRVWVCSSWLMKHWGRWCNSRAMKVTIDVKPDARKRIGAKLPQPTDKPSNDQMRGFIERATRASLDSGIRRFHLMRKTDISGVSGTGIVAEGAQFANGKVVVSWLTEYTSVVVFDDVETAEAIHCHGGLSEIVWLDE